jgi:superoxide reductase
MIKTKIFKCLKCNNIIEKINNIDSIVACCDKKMIEIKERSVEASTEKHIPIIKKVENGIQIIVGEIEHPMKEDHYIEWIDLINDNKVIRTYLSPNDKPVINLNIEYSEKLEAKAYCNLHGLWNG